MNGLNARLTIATLVAAAGLLVPAGAFGATPPPFKPTGTLKITAPDTVSLVHVKFSGTLPNIKQGEYAAYFTTFMETPVGHCNSLGIDTYGNPSHPKRKATDLDPSTGMEWGALETPNWCAGSWFAQAFVYHKKNGAYHPRLVFARKTFSIG